MESGSRARLPRRAYRCVDDDVVGSWLVYVSVSICSRVSQIQAHTADTSVSLWFSLRANSSSPFNRQTKTLHVNARSTTRRSFAHSLSLEVSVPDAGFSVPEISALCPHTWTDNGQDRTANSGRHTNHKNAGVAKGCALRMCHKRKRKVPLQVQDTTRERERTRACVRVQCCCCGFACCCDAYLPCLTLG